MRLDEIRGTAYTDIDVFDLYSICSVFPTEIPEIFFFALILRGAYLMTEYMNWKSQLKLLMYPNDLFINGFKDRKKTFGCWWQLF